jgi:hypothetical protein
MTSSDTPRAPRPRERARGAEAGAARPSSRAAQAARSAEAVALLDRTVAEARRMGRPDLAGRLDRQRLRVHDPNCQVLVVGEFKKGKSALINALLNARVCPVDADLATAVPTMIRYGPRLAAATVGRPDADGGTGAKQPIQPASLDDVVTERVADRNGEGGDRATPHSVEVQVPRALLRQGLTLIDTPGVGGGLAAAHAAATLRALSMADAVLFVTDASQELAAPELAFLKRAADLCPTVIGAITKVDFYPEWRRILDLNHGHLRRANLQVELLPLSAPLRHHALRTSDTELNVASGYPRLAEQLRSQALAGKEALAVRSAASAARSVLGQLATGLVTERAGLADPSGGGPLLEQLQALHQRAERLRGAAARWQQTLNDRFGDMISNVDMDLAKRLRAIRKEATERIEATDPAKDWADLQAWLYQRTNDELAAHHGAIRDEAVALTAQVARHFGDDAGDLTAAFELAAPIAARDPAEGGFKFERLSHSDLALLAMRSSTSGFVITGMVGTFLAGGVLAMFSPLLTPAAALIGVAMARSAVRQARSGRIKSNRAEALRAFQQYLEEAELVARKESRDTLRRVHQHLRDYFGARAEEMHVSVKRSLEGAAQAVKSDKETRKRRLEESSGDVTRLRALMDLADRLLASDPAPAPAQAKAAPRTAVS